MGAGNHEFEDDVSQEFGHGLKFARKELGGKGLFRVLGEGHAAGYGMEDRLTFN